jgi:hypothetical protein
MRKPSLHITEELLAKVLEDLFGGDTFHSIRDLRTKKVIILGKLEIEINKGDNESKLLNSKKLARSILTLGKRYTPTNRKLFLNNTKTEKKASKIVASDSKDALLFSNLLTMLRKQMKHRGVMVIDMGSKDWPQIKTITALASDFCEEFELDKKPGFTEYIKLAINKMGKWGLNKFPYLHEAICIDYQAIQKIRKDPKPGATKRLFEIYDTEVYSKTGIREDLEKNPQKYQYFVDARQLADSLGITYEIYIKAQFEGLAWANGIPEPTQLVGDKATNRLNKYLYQNKIKVASKEEPTKKVNWDKIKKL